MAKFLKFWIQEVEGLYYLMKTEVLISMWSPCSRSAPLYLLVMKERFYHDAAHMIQKRYEPLDKKTCFCHVEKKGTYRPRCEPSQDKTSPQGFPSGQTQIRLYNHSPLLEA